MAKNATSQWIKPIRQRRIDDVKDVFSAIYSSAAVGEWQVGVMIPVAMKPMRHKAASDDAVKSTRLQLKNAHHDLQTLRTAIKKTNEVIRKSREAIARTDALIEREK